MGARELLAGLAADGFSLTADGDHLVIAPASKLTDPLRAALRDAKPSLLALLRRKPPAAPAGAELAAYLDRRARLVRWGWHVTEAEALAARLARRDLDPSDDRVSCVDCRCFRPGRCADHRRAGLDSPSLGRHVAALLQRCPAFEGADSRA